jgi:hypothetical protein
MLALTPGPGYFLPHPTVWSTVAAQTAGGDSRCEGTVIG